ncbi:ArsR/SmtB family transcription factor [Tenacibaculum xiamenense]|uniref:ArsR/SmtB family transcription factor n=1 Tax=Tenacibaculum xiamenense TaxID=1261553 RepID=UPI00389348B0
MESKDFKNTVYQELANVAKALANPFRLRVLNLLAQDDYSVEQIANNIHISIANASQHLQVLKKVKLVKTKKNGHFIIYSLANNDVFTLWNTLQKFGLENSLEIQSTLKMFQQENFESVEFITADEITRNNSFSDLCFLDVRPEKEFKKEAIANAICIPIDDLEDKLSRLPKDKQIVVYCRGPFCVFADKAVQHLQAKGYDAIRLKEEVLSWKEKGLPVSKFQEN